MRAFGSGLDQIPELAVDLLQLAALEAQVRPRLRMSRFAYRWKLGDELLHQIRMHEMGLEIAQHAGLDHLPANGQPVVAGSAVAGIGAAIVVVDLGLLSLVSPRLITAGSGPAFSSKPPRRRGWKTCL